MTTEDLTRAIHWRYATKAFDPSRSIPADTWDALLDALHYAPSSFGLQPWKFLVIENPNLRQQLRAASWNQPQVTDADKLLVLTSRTDLTPDDVSRWITCMADAQGQSPDELSGYANVINQFSTALTPTQRLAWNTRQTYLALGQLMTAAAVLEIDTCPLEGIDPAQYDTILDLSDSGYTTSVACALGYRSPNDPTAHRPKARFPRKQVIEER